MEAASRLLTRLISAGLVMALLVPPSAFAGDGKQDPAASPQQPQASQPNSPTPDAGAAPATAQSQSTQTSRDQLPDSPDTVQSPTTVQSQTNDQAQPPTPSQSKPPRQPPVKAQEPLGTAAAELESTTGVAASKPAGTAIAPGKQKRARMILIKVSALVGAGVAIGTVAALSSASPSRPPGSH